MLRRTFRVALATALFVVAAPLSALADEVEFEADLSPEEEVQTHRSSRMVTAKPNSPCDVAKFATTWNGMT